MKRAVGAAEILAQRSAVRRDEDARLSGPRRVAARRGSRRGELSARRATASERAIRSHRPDPARRGVGAGKHCRGQCAPKSRRLPPPSRHCARLSGGGVQPCRAGLPAQRPSAWRRAEVQGTVNQDTPFTLQPHRSPESATTVAPLALTPPHSPFPRFPIPVCPFPRGGWGEGGHPPAAFWTASPSSVYAFAASSRNGMAREVVEASGSRTKTASVTSVDE